MLQAISSGMSPGPEKHDYQGQLQRAAAPCTQMPTACPICTSHSHLSPYSSIPWNKLSNDTQPQGTAWFGGQPSHGSTCTTSRPSMSTPYTLRITCGQPKGLVLL